LETKNATENSLAKEMVGREVIFRLEREKVERGNPILQVEHLSAINDKGIQALNDINFSLHEGEILGIAGISGNGQQVLAEVLAGLRKVLGGKILMDGVDITSSSSLDKWQKGMGYIPSERVDVGSIRDYSIIDNIMMNYYFDPEFSKWGILDSRKIRKLSAEIIHEYGVVVPGPDTLAKSLSGGNLQKLILARVLSRKPRLIIANLPTQGLDVGAAEFVQNKLLEARKEHTGILLISEDLDEVLSLSDRVAPIYEGEFMGIIPIEQVKREDIGLMMAGLKHKVAEK
jgi:simple sugar transport system ATP-binding protein